MERQGKWICYPGDYEIMLAEKVQTRRFQRDYPIAPFWRMDSPWHNVRFLKEFTLEKPARLRFFWEGRISVFFRRPEPGLDDVYSYEFTGEMTVPAGSHCMEVRVYHPSGLPCLKIDGDGLITDETFEVGFNQIDMVAAAACDCGELTPNTYRLPLRPVEPVRSEERPGETIYDFGRLLMGFVRVRGEGKYRLYFGETKAEVENDASKVKLSATRNYFGCTEEQTRETFCEQTEFFDLGAGGERRTEESKAFRWLRVVGAPGALSAEEEYTEEPTVLRFETENERLQKIYDVARYTFSLCAREFYLDGLKRDRWLWGGDAYEAEKAEYYYRHDTDKIKRSIVALLGKSPVCRYVNHIMDFTMYTILSVWEYYEHTGDRKFLQTIEPILSEHLTFAMKRLSTDGFLCSEKRRGVCVDWVFVDWGTLPDKSGDVSFEQILFWAALRAASKIYGVLGKDSLAIDSFAQALARKTDEAFWDEERGVYVFAKKDGKTDRTVTCHANAFAVLYGFADERKKARIVTALKEERIGLSVTPFMIEFVLACLFETGESQKAAAMLEEYWGGMTDAGATTFWETYEKGETEETATAMYGRPFGRSLCHIWGAGPLYLIPRYYFGIRKDVDSGESFLVEPHPELTGIGSLTVPMKRGSLTVKVEESGVRVLATELNGVLKINGREYSVEKGKERFVGKSE